MTRHAFIAATPFTATPSSLHRPSHPACTRRPTAQLAAPSTSSAFLGSSPDAAVIAESYTVRPRRQNGQWAMGKVAKFGPFSPAVVLTRLIIGEKRLNKLRGKAISLHSQAITNFCDYVGTGSTMRRSLIRKAKENGSTLGFLS